MIWRLIFLVIYVLFFFIRSSYVRGQRGSREQSENLAALNSALQHEGTVIITARSLLNFIMLFSIILYVIHPGWLLTFALPIPLWLRLIGLSCALTVLPLLNWAHQTLGRQYSPNLELKEEHELITSGPYKVIRHPMYTILIAFMVGISLFAANTFILVPHLATIFLILLRLSKEEAMLIEEFGDVYREYMVKTGRLLPRLS